MDRGKRPDLAARNNKIYLDLKDIIKENALPFLPAKSIVKFGAVCRDWRLQISIPFFAHSQSLSCRSTSGFFLQIHGGSPSFIPIDANSCGVPDPLLRFLPEPVDIKSSSNGLLCCQGRQADKSYYICNPVTKQWKKLPKSNANHGSDPAIVLLFEPSLLNFVAEYKIICAFPSTDFGEATEFDIYSSREDSWEIAGEICFGDRKVMPKSGVHVNGIVYWMTTDSILAFDLTKERAQLLQGDFRGFLGVFSGKLCKVYVSGNSIKLDILVNAHSNTMPMRDRIRMWSQKQTVVLDSKIVGGVATNYSVLHVDSDIMVAHCGERTYSYDFKSCATKLLSSQADIFYQCFPYVNSLVSL
ncbi:F-box protein At5g49610-like [Solanum dulcamara]|uniref:F-box protein At5g49610-like n=1 Tax=Solanum dulcamara TaxID=45834 RepID=UPI0024865CF8|nr:F-box protein At5g49610-like [Solanum dulcamara]XP_055806668.1 F-box protein At5g49610-like [Solanum dulcamara]XP_055806669.1 F-box protein At5g49610-like [Solanum dulcamara]XP_055806671.1 F-box protein At5g49610-like [Solanum dulcamara]